MFFVGNIKNPFSTYSSKYRCSDGNSNFYYKLSPPSAAAGPRFIGTYPILFGEGGGRGKSESNRLALFGRRNEKGERGIADNKSTFPFFFAWEMGGRPFSNKALFRFLYQRKGEGGKELLEEVAQTACRYLTFREKYDIPHLLE